MSEFRHRGKAGAEGGTPSTTVFNVQLWALPDGFFDLPLKEQWAEVEKVTVPAIERSSPPPACPISFTDDAMAVIFFLVTLGTPLAMGILSIYFTATKAWANLGLMAAVGTVLALHPLERHSLVFRSSKLALALIRYITFEILVDRSHPLLAELGTSKADSAEFQARCQLQDMPALPN